MPDRPAHGYGYAQTDDGARIYFEQWGAGKGPSLVLAYSLAGSTEMWRPNIEALASHSRLILWDPRGHGRSSAPKEPWRYSLSRWVEDLRAVLDHLRLGRVCVGGLSMGGGIATRFALRYPGRCAGLFLSDSSVALGLPTPVDGLLNLVRGIEAATVKGMSRVADLAVSNTAYFMPESDLRAMYMRMTRHGYVNSARALLAVDYVGEALRELSCPALLIVGALDTALPSMRRLQRILYGSRLVIVPDAGHFANQNQPERWNEAATAFLCDRSIGSAFTRSRAGTSRARAKRRVLARGAVSTQHRPRSFWQRH